MYDYNCPDCNETKLQSDKNARKINEVIDQVNALIQVNNETVDFIEEKAEEKVEEIAEIKVNEVLGDLRVEVDNIVKHTQGFLNIAEYEQLCNDGVDGIKDWTNAIKQALDDGNVILPCGVYGISEQIQVNRRILKGIKPTSIEGNGVVIKWIGNEDPKKSMILVGVNDVGSEPSNDSSDCYIENIYLDGNGKIGFGIYGTYLTNETTLNNITIVNTKCHGLYVARCWYATISNIIAKQNYGCGITLGLPLKYSDGTIVNWSTSAPLQVNNCNIRYLRGHTNGKDKLFSRDNLNWGYGVGIGDGMNNIVELITSEKNYGVGLYWGIYSIGEQLEKIYLEYNTIDAVTDGRIDKPIHIVIDSQKSVNNCTLSKVFMDYSTKGGIKHIGTSTTKIKLDDVYYGEYLETNSPENFILKNCNYSLFSDNSQYDTINVWEKVVEVYTYFNEILPLRTDNNYVLYAYSENGTDNITYNYYLNNADGTKVTKTLTKNLKPKTLTKLHAVDKNVISIEKAGGVNEGVYTSVKLILFKINIY